MPRPSMENVTFLVTDIEGSTRLWERHPQAMKLAIARHDRLLRTAIETHGGRIFRTVGDSFFAAFATAPVALAAAVAAQRALHQEAWGAVGAVRVRVALHTGVAEEQVEDYFGATLARAQRLLASGHGGQTLLSHTTADLIHDSLPPEVSLRDLGEHRLKDLTPPEHIYQVVSGDLPTKFPALTTIDRRPNNLPFQPTALIGRDREVTTVVELLREPSHRLVTLAGTGGVGKTRIALQAAAELVDEFVDGVFFVSLAPLTDPSLVTPTMVQVLGIQEEAGRSALEVLREALRTKRLLLVLDSCEHVLDAAAELTTVLQACRAVKFLVTSRSLLRVPGELEIPISPLPVPRRYPGLATERASESAAVRLFVERAREVRPDFSLTRENALVIAEICCRLDGLPLAIELAAARIRLLPPPALLARMERRLPLLVGGARELPARQQTLRDSIAWSYDLLDEDERVLFRRLAVFVGWFTPEAAETVAGYPTPDTLTRKSLLRQDQTVGGETLFAMLETTREYALDHLVATGESTDLQDRHATWYLTLAEEVEPALRSQGPSLLLTRLGQEHDNLLAALRWLRESGDVARALRLGGALWRFWRIRAHFAEGRNQLDALLALPGAADHGGAFASAWHGAGILAFYLGDYPSARRCLERSVDFRRDEGDRRRLADALADLGLVAREQGDLAQAGSWLEEALNISRDVGDRASTASALCQLGIAAREQGDLARARSLLEESLAIRRVVGSGAGIIAYPTFNVGLVAEEEGEDNQARSSYRESLRMSVCAEDRFLITCILECFANLAAKASQPTRALRLIGAAGRLREDIGTPVPPMMHGRYAHTLDLAWNQLSHEAADDALTEGRRMTWQEAGAYALAEDVGG